MYFALFDDFLTAAVALYNSTPAKCRFVHKYRAADGQLTLKLTNDKVVRIIVSVFGSVIRLID